MERNDLRYQAMARMLEEQLKPAMGCTEPIAIAYAAALARDALGAAPEKIDVRVSGNIIKNAKSVMVPGTDGRKGIEAACAIGVTAGDAKRELEVIAGATDEQRAEMEKLLARGCITVALAEDARLFDIRVDMAGGGHTSRVRIADHHTHVVLVERDGVCSVKEELESESVPEEAAAYEPSIAEIFEFASTCDIADVRAPLERQIRCNMAIAEAGISGEWGAGVGRVLLDTAREDDIGRRACAYAAAGSDARMGGCELPVVINSGSGNQGITASVPIVCYAREKGVGEEQLYRALVLSNLVAVHQKAEIGCLSAYCGAISAGCAAGAGVAYLLGGDLRLINHTIVNSLAILSGTICDGAKASCAAKIASAISAGLLGYQMALQNRQFRGGDGIVKKGVENTIHNVGRLAKDGMTVTDREILKIMTEC